MERGYGTSLINAFKVANAFRLTVYDVWVIPGENADQQTTARLEAGVSTVRELRLKQRWLLRDLSRLSGVSKTTLARIEDGHAPSLRNAAQIAAAFGVSIYQLWEPSTVETSDRS
jgi:DNA-binding XRE family transcriptional regulator